ncbi:MAG TPA: hypothetical protein VK689_11955, partial [Armatimonadota bacterium]|nr:hypothetical protein [Armatimonadota bacterium]
MLDIEQLCQQLASGAATHKRRAWRALIQEGALWRGCIATVEQSNAEDRLTASYRLLHAPWDHSPLASLYAGSTQIAEEHLDAAR